MFEFQVVMRMCIRTTVRYYGMEENQWLKPLSLDRIALLGLLMWFVKNEQQFYKLVTK